MDKKKKEKNFMLLSDIKGISTQNKQKLQVLIMMVELSELQTFKKIAKDFGVSVELVKSAYRFAKFLQQEGKL